MDRDLHSEQPNVGSLRTYRSQSDLTYSYNRAMGIVMIAHRVGHVSLGVARRSGRHAQQGHVIRPTKRCGNCVTARRLLINSAQTFHHTSRWNLSIESEGLTSQHYHKKLQAAKGWGKLRVDALHTVVEGLSLPPGTKCSSCRNAAAVIRCKQCGPTFFLCEECTIAMHRDGHRFSHTPEIWKVCGNIILF